MGKVEAAIGWTGRGKEYRPLKFADVQRVVLFLSEILFRVFAVCVFSVLRRFQEGCVTVSADVF